MPPLCLPLTQNTKPEGKGYEATLEKYHGRVKRDASDLLAIFIKA